jgi:hypothetical protein
MKTLFEVEENYRGLGRSMLDDFFPGKLRLTKLRNGKSSKMGRWKLNPSQAEFPRVMII